MLFLKQSTAVDLPIGPFLDDTDGKTAETALTLTQPDIRLKKNGAAWAQKNAAQTLTHEEAGWYEVALDTTDTGTLGVLLLSVQETGALPVWHEYMVIPANMWDSWFGADKQQIDVVEWLGTAVATPTIAGVPETDVTHFNGSAGTFAGGRPEIIIQNDGITAAKLAADVTTEIQAGLATAAALAVVDDFLDTEITDIQARLPAALVSGRMDASVGAMAANVMTAAAAAVDLTAELQAGLATAAALTTVSGKIDVVDDFLDTEIADIQARLPAALVSGRIDASVGAMAPSVLTQTAVANSAISSAKIASDAYAMIADNVWDEDATGHQTQGSFGQAIGDPVADTDSIWGLVNTNLNATVSSRASQTSLDAVDDFVDTEITDIRNRLPVALVGGRIDASVGAMEANTLNASAVAADAVTEIQSGLSTLTEVQIRTAVGMASANLDTQIATLATQASVNIVDDFLDTEIAAVKAKTDLIPASPAAVGSEMTLSDAYDFAKGTVVMPESYAANGAAPTPIQAIYAIHQTRMQFDISGLNYTVRKLNNSTIAFVMTLNHATSPTSAARV